MRLGVKPGMRIRLGILLGIAAALLSAPAAEAAPTPISSVFGSISCASTPLAGEPAANGRLCSGITHTFDGTNIDVNVILPPAPASGDDGPYPTIGMFHGWGGQKIGPSNSQASGFVRRGYAVFSMTDRGWGSSCGQQDQKRLSDQPGCAKGYNHLLDSRYEVRDAQYLLGLLADEGVVDPVRIGATGPSYGGGMSMALGALKDRMMKDDGTLEPWKSVGGKDMAIAAAAPEIPWTDLAYSLQPNGGTLDYVRDAPYLGPAGTPRRIGIMKQSFVTGLFATGEQNSNYAPPGQDADADLYRWYALISGGEPYDQSPLAADIVDELTSHHSSYYIDHSEAPAPLLISNGWTDDLFPPDEAIRFYNRTRTQYPTAAVSLMFMDFGHQRGQNKAEDTARLRARQDAWFDHYVKGDGAAPFQGVTMLTHTCPKAAPSAGPFEAPNWAGAAPGEIRVDSDGQQVIAPEGGNPQTNVAFDPVASGVENANVPGSGLRACATASGTDAPGTATYRLDPAPAGGYTLMGSPTIIADILSPGPTSQIAARLLDVGTDGNETLVARGLWRPAITADASPVRQVFQLHPNGWKFEQGHIAKLELLPNDAPYGRVSNGQAPIAVSKLQLRLPVLDQPNGDLFKAPAGKVLPAGYELARDYQASSDGDGDGWPDSIDNCPADANPDQADSDGDGLGNACDTTDDDADDDAVPDSEDNCPAAANPFQEDGDHDGIGNACDDPSDMSLRVNQRRALVGRTYTFRFRVSSPDAGCIKGVLVTLGSNKAKTNSDGMTTIRRSFSTTGTKTARARKTGCQNAETTIRVRR
jgi:fermentation-respiration switch protein FrsA (DUF1100 family)